MPETALDNEMVLSRVRENFRGPASEWDAIAQGIEYVLGRCNTKVRYVDPDQTLSPGEFASRAATACLFENGVEASDIDLLVYGGIAREAFEPATASEVAGRLGATPLHAFDVTCACAGLVEALHVVAGYFALHPEIETALVCAGELWRDRVSYDLQSLEDVANLAAGLTLGNAATAFLVTRNALPAGSARLMGFQHKTLAEYYDLCTAPVDGHFVSRSKELFALAVHVPGEIQRLLGSAGWAAEDVDHYIFHQPSQAILERVFGAIGARPEACVHTHSLYGNTASTSWAVALNHRLKHGTVNNGDKLVIASAASGFTIVCASAVWES
ncbi:3-oxoacyl-ACP synthase III family protein [Mycobacterium cookii]|uniref:3-oxoacyl-ACP synthase n=1 Tax=Mycobacterium cookii TaxID=1775 RepID=A0A7I7KR95_9MYCO|nr:3-oxoacyl-[acyl-carrier-protein] synthase III C-terminal domain-containing protein [Mycobacterium cookii]BBX44357.1 3-oxoacyl-ACP synthase [Mycobacterium cookii]